MIVRIHCGRIIVWCLSPANPDDLWQANPEAKPSKSRKRKKEREREKERKLQQTETREEEKKKRTKRKDHHFLLLPFRRYTFLFPSPVSLFPPKTQELLPPLQLIPPNPIPIPKYQSKTPKFNIPHLPCRLTSLTEKQASMFIQNVLDRISVAWKKIFVSSPSILFMETLSCPFLRRGVLLCENEELRIWER